MWVRRPTSRFSGPVPNVRQLSLVPSGIVSRSLERASASGPAAELQVVGQQQVIERVSPKAVLGGFFAGLVVALCAGFLGGTLLRSSALAGSETANTLMNYAMAFGCAVLSGYVAAAMRPGDELPNAAGVAVLSLALTALVCLVALARSEPLVFASPALAVNVLLGFTPLLGGYIRRGIAAAQQVA